LLGGAARLAGRRIMSDGVTEQVVVDEQANRLVDVPMRASWHL
jgi:hypothetical protein